MEGLLFLSRPKFSTSGLLKSSIQLAVLRISPTIVSANVEREPESLWTSPSGATKISRWTLRAIIAIWVQLALVILTKDQQWKSKISISIQRAITCASNSVGECSSAPSITKCKLD